VAPGHYDGLVRAGTHTITASKDGFAPTSRTESLDYDKKTTLDLKLLHGERSDRIPTAAIRSGAQWRSPRWARRCCGGRGVLGAADRNISAYDNSAVNVCTRGTVPGMPGCATSDPNYTGLDNLRKRGETYQRLATIAYVSGA